MPLSERKQPDPLSKSQVKRDMLALQALGALLIELPEVQLRKLPLPDDLLKALLFTKTLKAHEAKRRQLQYIGKMMRSVDPLPIQAALKALKQDDKKIRALFLKAEAWRDQLLAEGDTGVQTFLEQFPAADRQLLRQLFRRAQQDRLKEKNTGAAKELFHYLHDLLRDHSLLADSQIDREHPTEDDS